MRVTFKTCKQGRGYIRTGALSKEVRVDGLEVGRIYRYDTNRMTGSVNVSVDYVNYRFEPKPTSTEADIRAWLAKLATKGAIKPSIDMYNWIPGAPRDAGRYYAVLRSDPKKVEDIDGPVNEGKEWCYIDDGGNDAVVLNCYILAHRQFPTPPESPF